MRYDVGSEQETAEGNDGGTHHVGAQQATETHARALHRDNLGIVGQFRGKENDGDEDEQRTEEVGKIGNEIDVVVENDLLHRGVATRELVDLLVEVENHGNHHDDGDEEDVGAEKLVDDVAVEPSEPRTRITLATATECLPCTAQGLHGAA